MELESEEILEPVSPTGQYLANSVLSLSIICVLESEIPIDNLQAFSVLNNDFLPVNSRFSSVMVGESNGAQKWKKVKVNLEDHVIVPILPMGMSLEFYDEYFNDYLSNIGVDRLPDNRPLWEVHLFKYPTCNAAGSIIVKFHHALGDGYSLLGALLSCLRRLDNPSIPLTLYSSNTEKHQGGDYNIITTILKRVPQVLFWIATTVSDFGASLLKSTIVKDVESPIWSLHDKAEYHPMTITTIEFSLDTIKIIKSSLKVTINDVITGIILLGSRLYMQGENENSSNSRCNALVLLNTRNLKGYKSVSEMASSQSNTMPWGNYFTFIHVPVPKLRTTRLSDPVSFVYETQKIITRRRSNAAVLLTGVLLDMLRKIKGPQTASRYISNTLKNSSIVISNVIGPAEKMSLDDHPIKGLYFFVTGAPQSCEITVISYMGKLRIGIGVEKHFIDPLKFKSCIMNAFNMISEAAVAPAL